MRVSYSVAGNLIDRFSFQGSLQVLQPRILPQRREDRALPSRGAVTKLQIMSAPSTREARAQTTLVSRTTTPESPIATPCSSTEEREQEMAYSTTRRGPPQTRTRPCCTRRSLGSI